METELLGAITVVLFLAAFDLSFRDGEILISRRRKPYPPEWHELQTKSKVWNKHERCSWMVNLYFAVFSLPPLPTPFSSSSLLDLLPEYSRHPRPSTAICLAQLIFKNHFVTPLTQFGGRL